MKLIIDVGRYLISYAVINYNEIESLKIEPTNGDLINIFDKPSVKFLEKIVKNVNIYKSNFPEIKDVIITIPTRDLLIKSDKVSKEDVVQKITEDFKITGSNNLVLAISRPYRLGKDIFTPASFYDKNLLTLVTELEHIGVKIQFQSSISRMIGIAKEHSGKIAIVETGFSDTRVVLAVNGIVVEFKEFPVSGNYMLKNIAAKNKNSGIEEIIKLTNDFENNLEIGISKEINDGERYLKKNQEFLVEYLRDAKVDKIIISGGLSRTTFLKDIEIPLEHLSTSFSTFSDAVEVPETMEYKVVHLIKTPDRDGLLEKRNIDILEGLIDVDDETYLPEKEEKIILKIADIIGEENEMNNDSLVQYTHEIKKYRSELKGLPDDLLQDNDSQLELVTNEKETKTTKDLVVRNITPKEEEILDDLKKKFKNPSKRESKLASYIIGLIFVVMSLGLYIFMNDSKLINIPMLRDYIRQPEIVVVNNDYEKIIKDNTISVVRKVGVNPSSINVITFSNKKDSDFKSSSKHNTSFGVIKVPKSLDFKYNLGYYIKRKFELNLNSTIDIGINVMEDERDNYYNISMVYASPYGTNEKPRGDFQVKGETKWVELEHRIFFDKTDFDDFISGKRKVGDPSNYQRMLEEKNKKAKGL